MACESLDRAVGSSCFSLPWRPIRGEIRLRRANRGKVSARLVVRAQMDEPISLLSCPAASPLLYPVALRIVDHALRNPRGGIETGRIDRRPLEV